MEKGEAMRSEFYKDTGTIDKQEFIENLMGNVYFTSAPAGKGEAMQPDYYKDRETINKQEFIISYLTRCGVASRCAFNIATAIKYLDRAGTKPGEDFYKEMKKAGSYLYRAVECCWPWEDGHLSEEDECGESETESWQKIWADLRDGRCTHDEAMSRSRKLAGEES